LQPPAAVDPIECNEGLAVDRHHAFASRTTPEARVELAAANHDAKRRLVHARAIPGKHPQPAYRRVRHLERDPDGLQRIQPPEADRSRAGLLPRVPRLLQEDDP